MKSLVRISSSEDIPTSSTSWRSLSIPDLYIILRIFVVRAYMLLHLIPTAVFTLPDDRMFRCYYHPVVIISDLPWHKYNSANESNILGKNKVGTGKKCTLKNSLIDFAEFFSTLLATDRSLSAIGAAFWFANCPTWKLKLICWRGSNNLALLVYNKFRCCTYVYVSMKGVGVDLSDKIYRMTLWTSYFYKLRLKVNSLHFTVARVFPNQI